ncbi:hypothetical protein Gotur_033627, partial [Gossypium turneri]
FQENQETESWSNFALLSDFKNQENQDFKSWKPWSKKLNLTAKAHWISVTSINDTSHKGPIQAQGRDGPKLPQGPITMSKARQMHSKLNETIQKFISKALDAYTKEKENQDSLSCFQENQETESWSNFSF